MEAGNLADSGAGEFACSYSQALSSSPGEGSGEQVRTQDELPLPPQACSEVQLLF